MRWLLRRHPKIMSRGAKERIAAAEQGLFDIKTKDNQLINQERKKKMAKQRIKQAAIEAAQDKTEVTAHIRAIGDLNREIKRLETEAGDKKSGD